MKKIITGIVAIGLILSMTTSCFAGALADWQAKQVQIAAVTSQIQQVSVLAQTDANQIQVLQALQAQLMQLQNESNALQPAAVQELQAQQVAAAQAQQAAAIQAQQTAAIKAQQSAQAQQAAILQAQQSAIKNNKNKTNAVVTTPASGGGTVYITNTGTKYHRSGCRSLRKSCIPISLEAATARGYTACGVCH